MLDILEVEPVRGLLHQRLQQALLLAQPTAEAVELRGVVNDHPQLVRSPGLRDIGENLAVVHGAHDSLQVGVAGQQNARRIRAVARLRQQVDALYLRHPLVRQHDLQARLAFDDRHGFAGRIRREDPIVVFQEIGQRGEDLTLVVDHQDGGLLRDLHDLSSLSHFAARRRHPHRHGDRHRGSRSARIVAQFDRAPVAPHDRIGDRKPQPGSLADVLGREERLEDAVA
jgi:hypothetical protein